MKVDLTQPPDKVSEQGGRVRVVALVIYVPAKHYYSHKLMFLIYINDLVTMIDTGITPKLYADDLKLYANLTCSSSQDTFQQNLNKLDA